MATAAELPPPPPFGELIETGPVALFLDFDGTLVDIARTPSAIVLPANLSHRLAALSARMGGRLALVSGRSLQDLETHLGKLTIACAGSHGAARRAKEGNWLNDPPRGIESAIIAEIETFASTEGALFEPKAHGAALHSRAVPHLEERCRVFMGELAARHGLSVKHGKFVAELVQPGADKGAAVRAFMAEPPFAGSLPVFLGDDETDEDGFAAAVAEGGLAVTIGPRDSQHARFGLADPAAVHQWLGL